jgi:hypothetical protein
MPYTSKPPYWSPGPPRPPKPAPIIEPEPAIERAPAWEYEPEPLPTTRKIRVDVEPTGARVYVNGRYRSKSPCTLTLSASDPSYLAIEADGYQSFTCEKSIEDDDPVLGVLELLPLEPDPETFL